MKKYIAIVLLLASGACFAQDATDLKYPKSVVAVCKNPTGYAIHLKPDGSKTEAKNITTGETWTFLWNERKPDEGDVLASHSKNIVYSAKAMRFMSEPRAINFLSVFGRNVWSCTIFLDKKTMIASKHIASGKHDQPIGSVFHSECDISIDP